ncbi:potassium channel family protein [Alkalicoccobacillus plakortidis]|uniref:TrkA family potassium uptake protein n=1 Tax=Alkalicoccobacillus plakortidis TaxID=444060 RepID=A0ABT0XND9_9BACI|nr:TrkA family potassium uptake protein [Alkalicoccobacillus plakortidis]MCM2677423.1 TrkA family potassium uptake protein [Alkalicoccobacillus plakortidis]
MKKQFIVIGLGRFGSSLTQTLVEGGHEVLAVDKDIDLVQNLASTATHVIQADATDEGVLRELGAGNFQHAIVAIGENLQSSILITLLLKEMNIPKVTVKAKNVIYGNVLAKIGADQVVFPERDMGIRLGRQLSSENIIDYIELSTDYNLVEMNAQATMNGYSIIELDVRAKYGLNIMAIKSGNDVNISPKAEDIIKAGDILLLIGSNQEIRALERNYDKI